jgi:scyllo-inositol 2-dehydrogenase (NADP+)
VRVIVVGLGVQGRKRLAVAGADVVATADPVDRNAQYSAVEDVSLRAYEAALVCTPDDVKVDILDYLLTHGKHVLVEKPLLAPSEATLEGLSSLAAKAGVVCYTAYNHRFEPHFIRMKEVIGSGMLGQIYLCRMFYGNGTARDIRDSAWRDRGAGVLTDLGSHLLDTALFWFGSLPRPFVLWSANRFENRAYDHVAFGSPGPPVLEMEATLLSWRNHFTADVYGDRGSAHISSLCKWGRSVFTRRVRVVPSGRPPEESVALVQPDPTWTLEYEHFKSLCRNGTGRNLANDITLHRILTELSQAALDGGGS